VGWCRRRFLSRLRVPRRRPGSSCGGVVGCARLTAAFPTGPRPAPGYGRAGTVRYGVGRSSGALRSQRSAASASACAASRVSGLRPARSTGVRALFGCRYRGGGRGPVAGMWLAMRHLGAAFPAGAGVRDLCIPPLVLLRRQEPRVEDAKSRCSAWPWIPACAGIREVRTSAAPFAKVLPLRERGSGSPCGRCR
jgi:hypothetical protein